MNKKDFFDRNNSFYFFDDLKAVGLYCKNNCIDETNHILRIADEVCRKEFLFDLKWDMERTYEPVIFKDKIQWDYMPGDDPEFIFQFNRHRFFICLGQAYAITGDEKYAKTFTELLMDWIENVPLTDKSRGTTWRTIEAGLRGEYWSKAFRYFIDSPYLTDAVVDAFYNCMITHGQYLIDKHSKVRRMSNWSILEDHGLFEIALTLPQNEITRNFASIALDHLTTEVRLQVMDDGTQWEQSPMYHNEVYHCLIDVIILASRNNIAIPQTILENAHKMVLANVAWKKPNNHQFMQGDSDDTDIKDLITIGAYVFNDSVLKYFSYKQLDFDSIWDLGIKAAEEFNKIPVANPSFVSTALTDSGNYYLRSNWSENSNLLHFHCGTLGAGHGHSDKLHFDLVINGEDVLVDAGRYNYVWGATRREFKDPTAHNTITVDNKLFTVCKDSWECSKLSQPVNQKHNFKDKYEFVQGGHLGYMDLDNGVFINRKIIHIKPDIYIIVDEMYTGGEHQYNQYFHFNEKGTVYLENNKATYTGSKAEADFYFMTPNISTEKMQSRISRNYNFAETNDTIKTSISKTGFCSAITVIHGKKIGSSEKLIVEKLQTHSEFRHIIHEDSWAEALKIQVRDKTYVVIVCHQEVNTPTDQVSADGCMGYGNVLIFDKAIETQVGTVMMW